MTEALHTPPRGPFPTVRSMLRASDATACQPGDYLVVAPNIDHFQPFGLNADPVTGAEGVVLAASGHRAHSIAVVVDDRRSRAGGPGRGRALLRRGRTPWRRLRSMVHEPSNQGATTMHNIDRFNAVCAVAFERLYSAFPEPVDLHPDDIAEAAGLDMEGQTYLPETPRRNQFIGETIRWLREAGFVWGEPVDLRQGSMAGARLSAKGLEALKLVPSSIDSSESIGEHLVAMIKNGTRVGAARLAAELFTGMYRLLGPA